MRSYDTDGAARTAVDAGDVHAAIVVPKGFTESLQGGATEPVKVLDGVYYGLQAQLAESVTGSYVAQVNADRLSVATAVAAGGAETDIPELAARAALSRLPEDVPAARLPNDPLKVISYLGPSMGMSFVLFTVGFPIAVRSETVNGQSDFLPLGRGHSTPTMLVLFVFINALAAARPSCRRAGPGCTPGLSRRRCPPAPWCSARRSPICCWPSCSPF